MLAGGGDTGSGMVRVASLAASVAAVVWSAVAGPPFATHRPAALQRTEGCSGRLVAGAPPASCVLANIVFRSRRGGSAAADWPSSSGAPIVQTRPTLEPAAALAAFRTAPVDVTEWGRP